MLRSNTYKTAFNVSVCCLWPATTYAASVTLGNSIGDVPMIAWLVVTVLSLVSGLVSLLHKIKNELKTPEGEAILRRTWKWDVSAHFLGAILAGILAFLLAEGLDLKDFYEAVFIATASWGGAKLMDKIADGLADGIVSRVVAALGPNQPPKKD